MNVYQYQRIFGAFGETYSENYLVFATSRTEADEFLKEELREDKLCLDALIAYIDGKNDVWNEWIVKVVEVKAGFSGIKFDCCMDD